MSLFLIGCKSNQITGEAIAEETPLCVDTDGGITKEVQGVVTVDDNDYEDQCANGILIEYYCDGNNKANQNIKCPGCTNGKCP